MKFRAGMSVRIVDMFDYDDPMGINVDMELMKGRIAKVTQVGSNINGEYVKLDIDRGRFKWTETMVKPAALNKGKVNPDVLDVIKKDMVTKLSGRMTPFQMEYVSSWVPEITSFFNSVTITRSDD